MTFLFDRESGRLAKIIRAAAATLSNRQRLVSRRRSCFIATSITPTLVLRFNSNDNDYYTATTRTKEEVDDGGGGGGGAVVLVITTHYRCVGKIEGMT